MRSGPTSSRIRRSAVGLFVWWFIVGYGSAQHPPAEAIPRIGGSEREGMYGKEVCPAIELAILMDESRTWIPWNGREQNIMVDLLTRLSIVAGGSSNKFSISHYCDTPKSSGLQDRCYTPGTALVDNRHALIPYLRIGNCSSYGEHELGYSLGWVAKRYAGFSPPSSENVARHLLFTVDRDIRSGTYIPNYEGNDLLCDDSVEAVDLSHVGQVLRDAKVRPMLLFGGSDSEMDNWTGNYMRRMGFEPGMYDARRINTYGDGRYEAVTLFNQIMQFSCPSQVIPEIPTTVPPTTEAPPTNPPSTESSPTDTPTTKKPPTDPPSTESPPTTASTPTTVRDTEPPSTTEELPTEEVPPVEDESFGRRNQSTIAIIGALGGFVALASGAGYYMWNSLPSVQDVQSSDIVTDSNQMPGQAREQFLDNTLSL